MFTLLFIIVFLGVFGKLLGVAIKASWGLTKVLFTLVFLPVAICIIALSGLLTLAFPILIVVGIVMLAKAVVA